MKISRKFIMLSCSAFFAMLIIWLSSIFEMNSLTDDLRHVGRTTIPNIESLHMIKEKQSLLAIEVYRHLLARKACKL